MSNERSALTLALGVGGGLAASYLMHDHSADHTPPGNLHGDSDATPDRTARACAVRLAPSGLTVDGARVGLDDAIERCKVAGRTEVTIVAGAPATTYAELMAALGRAGVPAYTHRNAGGRSRNAERWSRYTVRIYPQGSKAPAQLRWFRSRSPIPWSEARLRLERAGVMNPGLAGKTSEPGGWMMSVDPTDFRADRAEPMPRLRNADTSSTFTLVTFPTGIWGSKRTRWFRAERPITWMEAHARLVAAGILGPGVTGRWKLLTDPDRFLADRAEPLPDVRNAELSSTFTLVIYPEGTWGPTKIVQWFYADPPVSWEVARDRLAAARILDPRAIGPNQMGAWKLVTDPSVYRADRAKPLPGGARNSELASQFTLVTYPEGVGGPKRVRWFYTERPILYSQALERLDEAGLLDAAANLPLQPGYWILVTSPQAFNEAKAEPLPRARRRRGAARAGQRYTTEGRTILRDGEPILYVDRVDLGDGRYALSPHHADLLTQRMVRLLNKREARP